MEIYKEVLVEADKVPLNRPFRWAKINKKVGDGEVQEVLVKLMVFKDVVMMPQKEFNELIFHLESKEDNII